MASISNLGYLVLGVKDLEAWKQFAVDTIGLQPGRSEPGKLLALRMDGYEQRIVLERHDDDDMLAAGWELDTQEDLNAFAAQLRQQGVAVQQGDAALAKERRVEDLYFCTDPNGIRHEFYVGAQRASMVNPFHSSKLVGGFSTGRLGMGHFVAAANDAQETIAFCKQVLGIKISDFIRGELAPGVLLDVAFFHARTGRHHSMATVKIPFPYPKRIHHIMVEVDNPDDVGLAYDRCVQAGYTINMGLGRHPNDRMFSFYVHTPSGFLLEFGAGGIVVDDADWEIKSYTRLSEWGHHHPEPH
ncbi:MAG: VOC family protein [Rubrivivax sp.]|uniref:VOC family protein n=1 Tax=Ottowia sp. TaxID=1898956 RepID=UPI0011DBCDC9|nr:VOC family protein [Ottowia sp.]MCC6814212.1 VOC family protein [Rubrivivax sp.]MCZ2087874.1 VOC family protein [Burkholderiales bacterium]HMZ86073.1 VOC family protein [Giesbergeria sp.]TXI17573.1 MAG: glyoxalase [Ottowia sp.]HNE70993.1 VOC family protein [Giesbergeria sp.]